MREREFDMLVKLYDLPEIHQPDEVMVNAGIMASTITTESARDKIFLDDCIRKRLLIYIYSIITFYI